MKNLGWFVTIFAVVVVLYGAIVVLFGFEGTTAVVVQYGRVWAAVAALVVIAPLAITLFESWPPPRRDFLIAALIMMWISAGCFALWNMAGRWFGADTSVLTSPIAGLFSLFLVVGGVLTLMTPDLATRPLRRAGIIIGGLVGFLVVVVPALVPLVKRLTGL